MTKRLRNARIAAFVMLALFLMGTVPAAFAQNHYQLFGPVNVATVASGSTFNTATASLTCSAVPDATISSNAAGTGRVFIDNYFNLSVNGGASTDRCTGGSNDAGVPNCFVDLWKTDAAANTGKNPDTTLNFLANYGVPALPMGGLPNTPGAVTLKIDMIDNGGYIGSSSIWMTTACTLPGITGNVYVDADNDGAFDNGEVGPAPVTFVKLINSSGAVVQVVQVNPSTGAYSFRGLLNGTYTVVVDTNNLTTDTAAAPPAGFIFRTPAAGSASVTISSQTSPVQNFGLVPLTVSGTIYLDANNDGAKAAGETGSGVATFVKLLSGSSVAQVVAANTTTGAYSFSGVLPGAYTIIIDDNNNTSDATPTTPTGLAFRTPATGSLAVTVASASLTAQDLGVVGGVSGNVYVDANVNNLFDAGELGTTATTYVKLISGTTVLQTVVPDPVTGAYSFTRVTAGTYTVVVDTNNLTTDRTAAAPSGFVFATPATGSRTVTVTVAAMAAQNFGLVPTISGTVYADANDNAIFDSGEVGPTTSAYVKLLSGSTVLQTVTANAASGAYTFAYVAPGTYTVIVDNVASTGHTTPAAPTTYSFRSPVSGSQSVTTTTTTGVASVDFGVVSQGVCVCGFQDGRFTQKTIAIDGDMSDWASVTADPDNNSCDPLGTADRDYPTANADRDITQVSITFDNTNIYFLTKRAGTTNNNRMYFYYLDTNYDGKMQTGEFVLRATWNGNSTTPALSYGTYTAIATGGDPLVGASGSGDGNLLPGPVSVPTSLGTGRTTADHLQMEFSIPWSILNGAVVGSPLPYHVYSTDATGAIGSTGDDNVGGCSTCFVTNQYAGVQATPNNASTSAINTTVYFAHTITNTGNGSDTFDLATAASPFNATAIRYYKDSGTLGVYDAGTDVLLTDTDGDGIVDTGRLAPGASINIIIALDLGSNTGTTNFTTSATSSFTPGCSLPSSYTKVSASVTDTLTVTAASISGYAYLDANHNGTRDSGEVGTGATLYAKLINTANPSTAVAAVVVTPATGLYTFTGVSAGTYDIILSTNSTLTVVAPAIPAGFQVTETPTLRRNIVVLTADVSNQNFGLFAGSTVQGIVFSDIGTSGGTPNDGLKNGAEAGISSVTVRLTDAGGSTNYDTTVTDSAGGFKLWIPTSLASPVIALTNPANFVNSGGSAGTTGGTYNNSTLRVSFSNVNGSAYTGVLFGLVPPNQFDNSGQMTTAPGTSTYYTHIYTPGTAGTVTFTPASVTSPSSAGFNQVIYIDTNCNGTLDAGEVAAAANTSAAAGVKICIIVKELVPITAPTGTQDAITITAAFSYANNPSLVTTSSSLLAKDLTLVDSSMSALRLVKTVDQTTALPGSTLTYTLTYSNDGGSPISNLVIFDSTPAYTVFQSASCGGTLPATLTGCALTTPAVNTSGSMKWSFTGSLNPGQSGSISFQAKIQ